MEITYYIAKLLEATREHESVVLGVSSRGGLALMQLAKALAFMAGRDYVLPDDVKEGAGYAFAHRLVLKNSERLCIWLAGEADKSNIVRLKMKREALADFLGVARPSLSRTLMKLQAEGLIEVHRKEIKIIDRKKLELFCE